MTEEDYVRLRSDCGGVCLACASEASGCEPDAREYECEICGEMSVYGIEELLIMGLVSFDKEVKDQRQVIKDLSERKATETEIRAAQLREEWDNKYGRRT